MARTQIRVHMWVLKQGFRRFFAGGLMVTMMMMMMMMMMMIIKLMSILHSAQKYVNHS